MITFFRCFSESSRLIHLCNKPISADESCKDYFPHFLWLMRDWNIKHSDGCSFTDYMIKNCLAPKKGKDSGRSQILSLFPSFTCHKVVRPGGEEPHLTLIDDLDKRFDAGIKDAIVQLCDKIDVKRGSNNVSYTSDIFIHLAEQYIKDLNTDDCITDLNLNWKITCQTRLETLSKKLILSYQEEMERNKFPVEEGEIKKPDKVTLFGMHSTIKSITMSQLHQECQNLLPHEKKLTSKIKKDFEEAISKELTELRNDNHLQSNTYCLKIFSQIDDKQSLEDRKKAYMNKAKGPAKHDVFKSKTSHISGPPEVFRHPQKNKVRLTWNKPKINPDAAKKFEIEIKEQNGKTWQKLSNDVHSPLDITHSTFKDLLPNHIYQVRIRGYDELKRGIGDFSKPQTIIIPCGVPNKPLCPTIQACMKDPTKVILQVATLSKLQENGKPVKKIIIEKKTRNNKWNTEIGKDYKSNYGESTWKDYLRVDNYDKKIPTSYRVIMRNDIGDSEPSEPVALDHATIIPGPPVSLKQGEITSNSIQLSWEKPKINPLAAHKYEVVCITTEWRAYSDNCSLEIKNLSPHTEYIFQVKALNGRDFGTQHSLMLVETKLPKPVKPRPVVAVDCDLIFATIDLKKSEEPKELIIMMYDEKKNELNEGDNIVILEPLEDEITEVECKIPYDDKIYFISVLCKNDDAESDPSDLVPVNPVGYSIQPGSPLNLKHRTDGNTVTLRWDKPEKKARAVTSYRIQKKLSSDDEKGWSNLDKLIEENQFTAEIKQLKYYTEYDFRVCAFNANIRGEYSEVLKLRTGCGKPAKPLRPSIEYQENAFVLTIEPISSEDEFGSKVTHVIIEHHHNEKKWERMKKEINESRSYEIPKEITRYSEEFRVCLQNGEGISEPSDPCSISTQMNDLIPGAIENLKLESKTGNSIDLCWDKPNINSNLVTGYCIKMKKKVENKWWKTIESDQPKIEVTELEENTEYGFEICAKGPFNNGIYHPLEGKTIEVFPGKPTNLRAHKKRDDCIKYRWEPPNEHPEAVAYYEVECKHHESGESIKKKKVTEASHSTVIRGLESNTYYDIHVTACNKFNHHHDSSILLPKIDTKFNTPTRISLSVLAGLPTFTIGGIVTYIATKPDSEEECQTTDEEY